MVWVVGSGAAVAAEAPGPAELGGEPLGAPRRATTCDAASLWEQLRRDLPPSGYAEVRAAAAYRIQEGEQLAKAPPHERGVWRRCEASILALLDAVWKLEQPAPQRNDLRARALDQLDVVRVHTGTSGPPRSGPAWAERRRRLRVVVGVTAGFTVAGVLLMSLPWIGWNHCANPDPSFGCGDNALPYVVTTSVGAVMVVGAAIPLTVAAVRLRRHERERPVGWALRRGGHVRLTLHGLRF